MTPTSQDHETISVALSEETLARLDAERPGDHGMAVRDLLEEWLEQRDD